MRSFCLLALTTEWKWKKFLNLVINIKGLWISGLQRSFSLDNLLFPFKLISSFWESKKIVKSFKPDLAVGTGGYASAPLLKMASSKGIPCVIQEQNSYAGINQ